ncbi:MarR family transcriptional regulator [Chryseobacterium lactis]|uniref:MarR family transcriptional regulator n=1 Tax=Chryseobacterium lactis TaxID=1241981 RepID=A0A3G6RLV4_CHRLC|nr:MarR family transcriptional regulator [Chryseobacterium lactis]AZA84485.1 MarR family transcriptional regulator [Chryseobacterium lactis]AZB04873.1 MarR family transcriptional regulator [Chryseobacterium lactis]PNW14604.1 MarR family transcriptional regulator [Chryseobacterium lactis]
MKKTKTEKLPLRRKLGITMVETYNTVYERSQEFFATYGLTSQQYNVLSILNDAGGPLSTSDILKKMLEKNAGVSRLVDRLILKELVEKNVNKGDKRLIDVKLTDKGEYLYQQVTANLSGVDEVYNALADEEVEVLLRLLEKMKKS